MPQRTVTRAYSTLTIKTMDEKTRRFTGIASTPVTDRQEDIVEPKGAQFTLPMPFLWQHDSGDPIGWIDKAKVTKEGIEVEGEVADIPAEDSPALKERLQTAWAYLKNKLVRGLSIGFRALETSRIEGTFGIRFMRWDWFELSAVTIPANQEASITAIKSIDDQLLAASGQGQRTAKAVAPTPGASGRSNPSQPRSSKMTLKEQIAALQKARDEKAARMEAIMTKAASEGRGTDGKEAEEFDNLQAEVETADKDLERLKALEAINASKAAPVPAAAGGDGDAAARVRGGIVLSVQSNLPKGTGFVRYAMALANSKGNTVQALEMAKRWKDSTPEVAEVLKSAVEAGTTTDATWASPLVVYQNLVSEFIELLRPATIIGRLPGLRRVPFNVRMPRQTQGGTYGWVGEKKPKSVTKLAFDEVTLRWAKAAGIIVISQELARLSSPSAEQIVRQDMITGIGQFLDTQFVDPTVAEEANVHPASITNGITPIQASGTDAAAVRADVGDLFEAMLGANVSPTSGAWIMTSVTAMRLSLMLNPLGQPEFPGITPTGGTFLGYPVVTSEAVPAGSDGALIIFINQNDVFLSEEGLVIDVSGEASLQMDTSPDDPVTASTTLVSLWQHNLVGLRAERFINWARRRDASVGIIESVAYGT